MQTPLRVVLVEDLESDATVVRLHLSRNGIPCALHRVQSETEFIDALEAVKPDIILSDFSMPQFDGLRALELAATLVPQVPFIFVSGTIGEERAIAALRGGATDYVLKGNLKRLPSAVQRALRESELTELQRQAAQQLRDNEARLRATIETSKDWIWETDVGGKFRYCSAAVTDILGYQPAQVIGQDFRDYLTESERGQTDALLPAPGNTHLTGAVACWRTVDGQLRWLERNVVTILDELRRPIGYRGTERDITARREQEARLRRLTRSYRMLSSTSSAILRLRHRSELIHQICQIAVHQGGYERAAVSLVDGERGQLRLVGLEGGNAETFSKLDEADLTTKDRQSTGPAEQALRVASPAIWNDVAIDCTDPPTREALLKHGYQALAAIPIVSDGANLGVISLFSAYSGIFDNAEVEVLQELAANLGFALQSMQKAEAVRFLSHFDPLTGLAKRALCCEQLTHLIAEAGSNGSSVLQAVVFDVQKLCAVNDSFGRYVGDRLLEAIARRLRDTYSNAEQLGYLGGGTFVVALIGESDSTDLGVMLRKSIADLFAQPLQIEAHELRPVFRYGVAAYPDNAANGEALIQYAEAALTAAREDNEKYLSFTQIRRRPKLGSFELESRLDGALERREFLLHYQPKVSLITGEVAGYEALLRWRDSVEGLVSPAVFIPLLERSGAIVDVGAWVLQQAAQDIHHWRTHGLPDVRVAVNVSPMQLRRGDFVAQVLSGRKALGGFRPDIDIEITESMLMQDIEASTQKLAQLREAGVGVAIDDFGTGYSSLRLLAGLPVDTLKIDRSFVVGGEGSATGLALLSTVSSLARTFHMKTVAEGVETEQQVAMLRQLEVDQAQGYFFARPIPAAEVPTVASSLLRAQVAC
jgi:PAS domain S-box-containing protein/diguanylate cyclase (GGDEF)-like protein